MPLIFETSAWKNIDGLELATDNEIYGSFCEIFTRPNRSDSEQQYRLYLLSPILWQRKEGKAWSLVENSSASLGTLFTEEPSNIAEIPS